MCPGNSGIGRRVLVGIILKPVGLKGEVKVKPLTDNPERYAPGGKIWMDRPGTGPECLVVRSVSGHKDILKVLFEGVGSVEDADRLRGLELYVREADVPPLEEGEYYHFQVIGAEVYTDDGRLLGKVTDIIETGEKDVYVVMGGGKEYLIPVTEEHVRKIDVKSGRIDLYPMEGYIS